MLLNKLNVLQNQVVRIVQNIWGRPLDFMYLYIEKCTILSEDLMGEKKYNTEYNFNLENFHKGFELAVTDDEIAKIGVLYSLSK